MVTLNLKRLAGRVTRARSALNRGIRYKLGKGGFDPAQGSPADFDSRTGFNLCDCSGYVAWVIEISRKPKKTRPFWVETSAMCFDANNAKRAFMRIDKPVPGCIVAYPDRGGREGHTAIVTGSAFNTDGSVRSISGIDCSSGQSKRLGQAITERDLSFFLTRPGCTFMVLREDLS